MLHNFLLNYRATPHRITNLSPAKLLFNRELKTLLPQAATVTNKTESQVTAEMNHLKNSQIIGDYVNKSRNVVAQNNLLIGDQVRVAQNQTNKTLTPLEPNIYTVMKVNGSQIVVKRIKDGRILVRNSSQVKFYLRPTMKSSISKQMNQTTVMINKTPNSVHQTTLSIQPTALIPIMNQQQNENNDTPPPTPAIQQQQNFNQGQNSDEEDETPVVPNHQKEEESDQKMKHQVLILK